MVCVSDDELKRVLFDFMWKRNARNTMDKASGERGKYCITATSHPHVFHLCRDYPSDGDLSPAESQLYKELENEGVQDKARRFTDLYWFALECCCQWDRQRSSKICDVMRNAATLENIADIVAGSPCKGDVSTPTDKSCNKLFKASGMSFSIRDGVIYGSAKISGSTHEKTMRRAQIVMFFLSVQLVFGQRGDTRNLPFVLAGDYNVRHMSLTDLKKEFHPFANLCFSKFYVIEDCSENGPKALKFVDCGDTERVQRFTSDVWGHKVNLEGVYVCNPEGAGKNVTLRRIARAVVPQGKSDHDEFVFNLSVTTTKR